MNKLWQRLNHLFAQQQMQKPEPAFVQNNIDAPLVTKTGLDQWRVQLETYSFFQSINGAFRMFELASKPSTNSIQFIHSDSTFGCAIHCKDFVKLEDYDFLTLMEHIKEQLESNGYTKNIGDIKSRMQGQNLDKIYRYYMKPSIGYVTKEPINQLYGNATLTYTIKNGLPYLFKFWVTSYSDRRYDIALPYHSLMEVLFD